MAEKDKVQLFLVSPISQILELWLPRATDAELEYVYTFTALYPLLRVYAEEAGTEWWWINSGTLALHMLAIRDKLEEIYHVEFTEKYNRFARKMVWQLKFKRLDDSIQ